MSLWYDIDRKSYASNSKSSWIRAYAEKIVAALKSEINSGLELHYTGREGRHKAADVDCGDGNSVQKALSDEKAARMSADSALQAADAALQSAIDEEASAREAADEDLQSSIEEEAAARAAALNLKVDKVSGKGLSANDYSDAYKEKLDGIESGAQVNTVTSVAGKVGAVALSKSDVGLGNVNNTSDLNKPISTAVQTALNGKADTDELTSLLSQKASLTEVLSKTNTAEYTPQSSYHPATKKYVDDSISSAGGGDMLKNVYDTNSSGVVDNSEKLGGQLPSYYAPKNHSSSSTTYGTATTSYYGHVKLVDNLTSSYTSGYALTANQGRILSQKITAITPAHPALTSTSPDGTKIGVSTWTGTGWFCTNTGTKYTAVFSGKGSMHGFNRFCLKPSAADENKWYGWTPFFDYNGSSYEFFYSPSRGLYEALIPANSYAAQTIVNSIRWENHSPTLLKYGKLSNAFGICKYTDSSGTDKLEFLARSKSHWRDTSGVPSENEVEWATGLASEYCNFNGVSDVNIQSLNFMALDVDGNGQIQGLDVAKIINLTQKAAQQSVPIDTIDNF